MKELITPPNPYAAAYMTYDYEVQGEVAYIRWREHATYLEIMQRMTDRYGIIMDHTAVELILKGYEIACANSYRQSTLDQIQTHGGILLCVDVMDHLKGKKGIVYAQDY